MSLSDCSSCWQTPCFCGAKYKDWPMERRIELVEAVLGYKLTSKPKMNKVIITMLESGGFTVKSTGFVVLEIVPLKTELTSLSEDARVSRQGTQLNLPANYWAIGGTQDETDI